MKKITFLFIPIAGYLADTLLFALQKSVALSKGIAPPKDDGSRLSKNSITSFCVVFALTFFPGVKLQAQCDSTNDIIQNSGNSSFFLEGGTFTALGNTFTPTCSGKLEGISVWIEEVEGPTIGSGASALIEVYSNPVDSDSRKLIGRVTKDNIPISSSITEQYFEFTTELELTAGTAYTYRILRNDSEYRFSPMYAFGNPYSGGQYFSNDFISFQSNVDMRFHIHFKDEAPPVARCKNITRSLGADGTVSISANDIDDGSTDADSGISIRNVTPGSFDCSNIGANTVTLFLRDNNGNNSSCNTTVTIIDDTQPVLECPDDITAYTVPNGTAVVEYTVSVLDNCTTFSEVVQTTGLSSGSSFPMGETTNTFEYTDGLGNTTITAFARAGGDLTFNTLNIGNTCDTIGDDRMTSIGGYQPWSNLSDGRFKREVAEDVPGLEFVTRLRPVSYRVDRQGLRAFLKGEEGKSKQPLSAQPRETGFIAQEVEEVAQALGYAFNGIIQPQSERDHYQLSYATFVVPLVQAVQEQQELIEKQQTQIAALQDENNHLRAKVDRLEQLESRLQALERKSLSSPKEALS